MKKLIIVRHSKSTWNEGVSDHDRSLKKKGIEDAKIVSEHFKQLKIHPDQVISSTAKRAKLTAEIFSKNLKIDTNSIHFEKNIYDFTGDELIETIKSTKDHVETLMVFGHNYAITNFVNNFGDRFIENVPTSGLVVIEFHVDYWKYIYKGQTINIIFPRDLRE